MVMAVVLLLLRSTAVLVPPEPAASDALQHRNCRVCVAAPEPGWRQPGQCMRQPCHQTSPTLLPGCSPHLAPSLHSPLSVPAGLSLLRPLVRLCVGEAQAQTLRAGEAVAADKGRRANPLRWDPRRWLGHCCCWGRGTAEMCRLGVKPWPTQQQRRGCCGAASLEVEASM